MKAFATRLIATVTAVILTAVLLVKYKGDVDGIKAGIKKALESR